MLTGYCPSEPVRKKPFGPLPQVKEGLDPIECIFPVLIGTVSHLSHNGAEEQPLPSDPAQFADCLIHIASGNVAEAGFIYEVKALISKRKLSYISKNIP